MNGRSCVIEVLFLTYSLTIFCRRDVLSKKLPTATDLVDLPCDHYDYSKVFLPFPSYLF